MDDKWQESWDRMEEKERRDIGEASETCKTCDGKGSFWQKEDGGRLSGSRTLCRSCLGTKVQPMPPDA